MLVLSASTTLHAASAFSIHRHLNGIKLGTLKIGGIGDSISSFTHPRNKYSGYFISRQNACFSLPDSLAFADDDDDDRALVFDIEDPSYEGDGDEIDEIINGTSDGLTVTKLYNVPPTGFSNENNGGAQMSDEVEENLPLSLSDKFSPEDVARLRLEPQNITLPAALMLLDPEQYPTQSRARKVIRQKSICISRNNPSDTTLNFTELGKVIKRVYPGDVIGVQSRVGTDYYATQNTPYRPPPFEVPVLYEDDHMAIVNKPAGVVMYRAEGKKGGHGRDTLLSALPYVLTPSNIATTFDDDGDVLNFPLRQPQPVHRLDRPTSGLMIVAKTKAALMHLSQQFEYRKARKTYTAIVNGDPLTNHENNKASCSKWNEIDHDLEEKSAITKWRVIRKAQSLHAKAGQLTLVELKPKTGRYHQLRRHMAWVCQSPLAGDTTYDGADASALRLRKRGLFLCSNAIELEHPYYNTPFGNKEWVAMCHNGEHSISDNVSLRQDKDTGIIMIKARTALPDKFESFLERENDRAIKFGNEYGKAAYANMADT